MNIIGADYLNKHTKPTILDGSDKYSWKQIITGAIDTVMFMQKHFDIKSTDSDDVLVDKYTTFVAQSGGQVSPRQIRNFVSNARWFFGGCRIVQLDPEDLTEILSQNWTKPNHIRSPLWIHSGKDQCLYFDEDGKDCNVSSGIAGKEQQLIYAINELLNNPPIEVSIKKTPKTNLSPSQKKKFSIADKEEYVIHNARAYVKRIRLEQEAQLQQERQEEERRKLLVFVAETSRKEHLRHYKNGKVVKVKACQVRAHHRGDLNDPLSVSPKKISI